MEMSLAKAEDRFVDEDRFVVEAIDLSGVGLLEEDIVPASACTGCVCDCPATAPKASASAT